jgi:hypothetical protein
VVLVVIAQPVLLDLVVEQLFFILISHLKPRVQSAI